MLGHIRFAWILTLLTACAGADVARLETQVDALTERVQVLEGRTKSLEAKARRAGQTSKAGKNSKTSKNSKNSKTAKGGKGAKTAPAGTKAKGAKTTPAGGAKAKGAKTQPPQ